MASGTAGVAVGAGMFGGVEAAVIAAGAVAGLNWAAAQGRQSVQLNVSALQNSKTRANLNTGSVPSRNTQRWAVPTLRLLWRRIRWTRVIQHRFALIKRSRKLPYFLSGVAKDRLNGKVPAPASETARKYAVVDQFLRVAHNEPIGQRRPASWNVNRQRGQLA